MYYPGGIVTILLYVNFTGVNMTVNPPDGEMVWSEGDRVEVLWDDTHTWWVGTITSVDDSESIRLVFI